MKKKYIAPQMETTPYEIVSIIARSPGYAIDNDEANDDNIIDIEEDPWNGDDDEWLDLW